MLGSVDVEAGGWDPIVHFLPFVAGLVLLLMAAISILRTMVIPRTTPSFVYATVLRATDHAFNGGARLLRGYRARDRMLAWSGPTGIIFALFAWLALFLLSYALMIYGVSDVGFLDALVQAGSALLTLGIMGTPDNTTTVLDFIAAMTGPAVIALLIGFLPTLYQSYLTRESRVLLSSENSGAPGWGPEVLARVHLLGASDNIDDVYGSWIDWCAQTRLSQTLYPALSRFRSPVGRRNWITSLLAFLDSAAIRTAALVERPDARTANLVEQGTQTFLAICATEVEIDDVIRFRGLDRRFQSMLRVFGLDTTAPSNAATEELRPETMPRVAAVARAITIDSLQGRVNEARRLFVSDQHHGTTITREEFGEALDYLRRAGMTMVRSDDDAYAIFRRIRGRYEKAAYFLAERFTAPPAPWSGPRHPSMPTIWPALAVDQLEDGR